jgi:hypothetical protein
MNIALLNPPPGDDYFAQLPKPVRDEVRAWVRAFRTVPLVRPMQLAYERIARMVGRDWKTVERKATAIRQGADWRVFIDGRAIASTRNSRVKDPRFQAFLKTRFEAHKRVSASAIEELYRMWRNREDIPGYEGWPGWPNIPEGWSERNLYRQQPSKTELKVFRIGLSSAYAGMPQVFSTRVGLWVMSHCMFDDMIHDDFIRVGTRGIVGRVMELDALDVLSSNKIAWGTKPRLPKLDNPNQMEGLKEKNMRLLVASTLFHSGYSPRGTVLLCEHGTAAIRERVRQILFDATGGKICVRDSGITGDEQAVLASWKGEGKGNPRFKAPIEVLRSLIHNRKDYLLGATGRNVENRPEILGNVLDYQQEILDLAARLPEQRRHLLIHPLLEYHSQFLPLLSDLYALINNRTNHACEGWEKCGFLTTDYRLSPMSPDWLGNKDFLALPEEDRAMLTRAVLARPNDYSRTRRMSPAEVFAMGSQDLPIGPEVVCDLLLDDLGREEKVKGSYFRFQDIEIDPEELIFEARIISPGSARERELPEGEKYHVFVNPFAADWLFVCDARKAFLGLARRVQRVSRLDEAATLRAFGRAGERKADRLAALRLRHEPERAAYAEMVATNEALADEATPFTDDEKLRERATRERIRTVGEAASDDIVDAATPAPATPVFHDSSLIDDILD